MANHIMNRVSFRFAGFWWEGTYSKGRPATHLDQAEPEDIEDCEIVGVDNESEAFQAIEGFLLKEMDECIDDIIHDLHDGGGE